MHFLTKYMKNKILKLLSKPKIIIPIFTIVSIVIVIYGYNFVGKAPKININNDNIYSNNINTKIDLSFPKGGRVESILVKVGQEVHKGDILAKLSAPDSEGLISQTKGALELAEAQYASLNSQYASAKKQQDLIVNNAYQTLLSSGLEATPSKQSSNAPIISGSYTCTKEGTYTINPYASGDSNSGYSFEYSGLEKGTSSVKYDNPIPFGDCGLQIKWIKTDYFDDSIDWTIQIPNTKSSSYIASRNAYELAKANREKVLADLANTIGQGDGSSSVAKAQVEAARGAYESALGAYQNNLIIAPIDGIIYSIDNNLKVGQSVQATKPVININAK